MQATRNFTAVTQFILRITFLGTGTSMGVPIIGCPCPVCRSADVRDKRLRTSVLLEVNGKTIVIDTGPDFRQQMLKHNVRVLDAVVFTHEHKDHLAGLDEVRAYNFLNEMVMPVYATMRVQQAIRREFAYIFETPQYPGIPQIDLIAFENAAFEAAGIPFLPVEVFHHKLQVFGFRVGDFVYITDANRIDEAERQKVRGCKVLVLNALRREPHISHFTLDEALEVVRDLRPEKAYFTHLSHQMGKHEEVQAELPDNVFLAFDGLVVEV
jgi:phosphoribosyl 1,2-cyclic phosphate phosphodiesterase